MKYIIYQVTNQVNGKIYIGKHVTDDLNDGYMGSGTILKKAIRKYGVDKFTKTILHIYDNENDMIAKEGELVNEEFVARLDTYNLTQGGNGSFSHINSNKDFYIKKQSNTVKQKYANGWKNPMLGKERPDTRQRMLTDNPMKKGHQKSEEHKRNIGLAKLGKKRAPFSDEWRQNLRLGQLRRYGKVA